MARPDGTVSFEAAGARHTLRFGINQLCDIEERLGVGVTQLGEVMKAGLSMRQLRTIFAAGAGPSALFEIGDTVVQVLRGGGEGPEGKSSGPLGRGSVGSSEISDDASEQAAVVEKLRVRLALTGAVSRPLSEKVGETISIADLGGVDDWAGSTGTNNFAALEKAYSLPRPLTIRLPRSRSGTGVYMVDGATAVVDATGVTLDPDPGVSLHVEGTGSPATYIKGQRSTRDLRISYADYRYQRSLGPDMRKRVTELGRPGSNLDGELQVPSRQSFMEATHWQTSGTWPNVTWSTANPASVSADLTQWPAPPSSGFFATMFHAVPGDLVQARTSDLTTYLPAIAIFTDSGWLLLRQAQTGDRSTLVLVERNGSANAVETSTTNEVAAQNTYLFTKSAVGIAIFDQRSFGLLLNGTVVRRYRTTGNIVQVGWAGGFASGGNFAVANAVLIKNKRSFGIKPLKVLTLGDSTGDETVTQQSQFDFMRQYIAGIGGCQIRTLNNLARSGDRSAQQLAALQSVSLDGAGYDYCLIQIGINDVQTSVAPATFVDNVLAMVTYCRSAGVEPIVGVPAMFYSQADAQAYGQDGGGTSRSDQGAAYRLALMQALSDANVFCNLASFEDLGAVTAALLTMKTSAWGDQVVYDNVHPTTWGTMLLGYGWAKTLAAHVTGAMQHDVSGVQAISLPSFYFTGGVGATATPRYTADGRQLHIAYYLSTNGVALADGTQVGTLPQRLRPKMDVIATLVSVDTALNTISGAPSGFCRIGSDGKVRVYGVAAGTAFISISASWKI